MYAYEWLQYLKTPMRCWIHKRKKVTWFKEDYHIARLVEMIRYYEISYGERVFVVNHEWSFNESLNDLLILLETHEWIFCVKCL